MENTVHRAVAIVGVAAILPDAPNAQAFWENIRNGRYSITEVTPDRWNPDFYYDPDPAAPDKTYSKIGGWVREAPWDPVKWRLPIPPRVVEGMDEAQKWGIACTREALEDYGYPKRPLDPERTAVILGNAMAGEKHYLTALRVFFPEYAHELAESPSFAALPTTVRSNITHELHDRIAHDLPQVTEDSMPGELANCLAGRIANLFNFRGPNYTCDAACASAMAAISSAAEGLVQNYYDAVITGGIDRNMGAPTFVKFCKIGALSATGTRPYAQGADGFVMGEGAALFLLKRLADAERDGDKIYAVLRGIGGSSDGKGKGITAPNPVGQRLCVERAWKNAGLSPATVTYVEGHGTSTRVGDVVEAQSMVEILSGFRLPTGSVAIGSVKSNFGHLKGGAGSAGLLKATLALHNKVLPPSLHCHHPSPDIDFAHSPLYVNTELKPWTVPTSTVRRAGVSAFGFGGTNFHTVLEEYVPGRLNGNGKRSVAVTAPPSTEEKTASVTVAPPPPAVSKKAPLRGALVIGAAIADELAASLSEVHKEAAAGRAPAPAAPAESDVRAPERLVINYADAADLADKSAKALKALKANQPVIWKALRAQGVFRGQGPAGKVAFLYTGQGSQYVNMLRPLRAAEPIVAETFAEADRVMTPLLGKPLSEFIFVDPADADAVAKAEADLRQTAITQPAVIASDIAMTRLLAAYGIQPDMTMGHSVGEYGALVASGALPFEDAMEAVSARGREMSRVSLEDKGLMVAVFAPREEIERILKTVNGYVVIANINSDHQAVIGGATQAVQQAMEAFQKAGYEVAQLPVSHAFHTSIVAEASAPLRQMLARLRLQPPCLPIVANINGEFYPTGPDVVPQMLDILAQQVASPVQFVKGLHTLYNAGVRVFVEVGPKKALQGFADDVFANQYDVVSLFTNHPKFGDIVAFNQALCGLYAAGLGCKQPAVAVGASAKAPIPHPEAVPVATIAMAVPEAATALSPSTTPIVSSNGSYNELGRLVADALERSGWQLYQGEKPAPPFVGVTITGAALGLPGAEHIFDDGNVERILRGEQFIKLIPEPLRRAMVDKHITRLVKSDNGGPSFETITAVADVIKLAGRGCAFDLEKEFGVSAERLAALDRTTQLAIAVGIDALRDAGIPLVMRYKTTSKGTQLPDRWGLPDSLRDDTGVIYASAFPSYESFAQYISGYHIDHARREQLAMLEDFLPRLVAGNGHSPLTQELSRRVEELRAALEKEPFLVDRRFLFRVLSMGHSQFAEYIAARGPNTQINSACASTTQAVSLAEDWIRAGRCRRVIVVSADDITTDGLMEWMGAGFLASGAAATDEVVEEAAIPFDRRRHGMIIGMGAAGMVVESKEAARERGIRPICEVVSAATANSAFHGTRLDVEHIGQVMENLITDAEIHCGISRHEIAPHTVFVSHETYTPARGGSASAEIFALRRVFGDDADKIVIANTKGLTGHAMGAGVEDIVAVKALETGCVPPVANFKEVDPELGQLNLSKGGPYPVEYALRLGAGFGSQISMTLYRWFATKDAVRPRPNTLGYAYRIADTSVWNSWLARIAGRPVAELEVVKRTLRVKDQGLTKRVSVAAEGSRTAPAPAPIAQAALQAEPVAVAVVALPAAPLRPASEAAKPSVSASVAVAAAVAPPPQPKTVAPATAPTATTKQEVKPAPALAAVKQEVKPTQLQPAAIFAQDSRGDSVQERILALMVEKTGYPKDMLDLDLDLEADLGVDTVKQAEIFAAIREIYNIPRDENRKLRDYPTLAHVIRFVLEKRPDLAGEGATAQSAGTVATPPVVTAAAVPAAEAVKGQPTAEPVSLPTAPTSDGQSVTERILALVVEKTGYPKDMLDLDLDLEADLGVDTVKQAEIFAAIREIYSIPRDENRKLRDYPTLAHVIRFVHEKQPGLATVGSPSDAAGVPTKREEPGSGEAATLPVESGAESEGPVLSATPVSIHQEEAGNAVKERILALVVEKTGYPKEMLDLDLDLEADLGIDTVKQAEMFTAIREIYNIPRDENRKLRDYPTLSRVIQFVYEKRPDLAVTASSSPPVSTGADNVDARATAAVNPEVALPLAGPANDSGDSVEERILALVVEKTGYPKDMLDLDLDLEADLGVDTVKQAEMFAAIREIYNIPHDENRKLRDYPTLAHVIRFVLEKRPDLSSTLRSPATTSQPASTPSRGLSESTAAAPAWEPAVAAADSIKEKVLGIVAEKTGYPKEMLDLDLDLEADLGIDTVKQAEMFAAIRGAYDIPRDENLNLRDFPTLAHVIKFAQDRSSLINAQKEEVTREATASLPSQAPSAKPISLDAANRIPRRVPLPVLRPPLTLCKPTSVKLEGSRRVIIMPDKGGVADTLAQLLRGRGVEVLSVEDAPDAEALPTRLRSWMEAGPVDGVYWLPALDNEGRFTEMDSAAWHQAVRLRIKLLYTTMRALYEHIAKPGTFLVSATRLGGQHGYDEAGAFAPLGGAVVGFAKTYKRERTEALVKAVDFESESKPAEIAERLIEETLRDPGAVEIGYKSGLRWTVGLQEQPAADGQPGLTLDSKTVFLITGAAGSIVSAITADLAAASGGTFYLLDLVPEPDPDNPDLKRFVNDKEGLKRDIFARIQSRGIRATPALVERELAGLERAQAAQSAIDAVRAAGGTPTYFGVNLTHDKAVARVIDQVRERSGRIDVLLHAAGLDRSYSLPDKEPGEFDLVFDVKSDGFFNLLHAIGDMPLGVSVAFSSIAGRFGNLGQTDYAAANDLLCKITSSLRTTRPTTRGIAIDWTAWGGIGMASRGSIPKVMEMAGIDMLPPETGATVIRNELTAGGTRGEVVIGERLGVLLKEWDETGGLNVSALQTTAGKNKVAQGPMFGRLASVGLFAPLRIETTLDPKIQPFLFDHQIDGTPVLPGVMGIEAFAEAALALLPGWHVEAIEEVNFLAPFKFYRNEPRTVSVAAWIHPHGSGLAAECQLIGTRTLANQAEPQVTTHFTARARLTREAANAGVVPELGTPGGSVIDAKDIYGLYFHGPAYQVIKKAWWNGELIIGLMAQNLPENHHPPDLPTIAAPRLIELCFQTAGIWGTAMHARMGLPLHIDRVSFTGAREMESSLYAVVAPCEEGSFKAEVVDTKGNCYLRLSGYRTAEVPNGINAERVKTLRAAISLEPALAR